MEQRPPSPPVGRRPQISRAFVELHRRRRFAAAAAEVAHEFGCGGINASTVIGVAGAARNTFYDLFAGIEDCMRFAIADAYERLFEPVYSARGDGDWLAETEAAIAGFYAAVAEDPLAAEFFLIHSFGVELGPQNTGHHSGVAAFERLLAEGRRTALARGCQSASPLAEEYLAHMVLAAATWALRHGEASALPGRSRPIAAVVKLVCLGEETSGADAERAGAELVLLLPGH